MNKRAEGITSGVMWEIIGLALFVFIAIGLAFAIPKFIGSSDENKELASTYATISLAKVINELVSKGGTFQEARQNLPFHEDFILVGFSKGAIIPTEGCDNPKKYGGPFQQVETISRPSECTDSACLCLYPQTSGYDDFSGDEREGFSPNKPVTCAKLPGVDHLLSFQYYDSVKETGGVNAPAYIPFTQVAHDNFLGQCYDAVPDALLNVIPSLPTDATCKKNGKDNPFGAFVLYGQCGGGVKFGTGKLAIEKMVLNGQTIILVANELNEQYASSHRKFFAPKTEGTT